MKSARRSLVAIASFMFMLTAWANGQAGSTQLQPAQIRVLMPSAEAQLSVDGAKTQQSGSSRRFVSPPLPVGQKFVYAWKTTWREGGQDKVRERRAFVWAGLETIVDLQADEQVPQGKAAAAAQDKPAKADKTPDVVYVPTPQEVVDKMLELAEVKKGDIVYDLGCGDGRILVTAAKKYGVKSLGVDIDPERVAESLENVKKAKLESLVTIKKADIFDMDLREASVVTLYLLPSLNVKLRPQLAKLKPGSRVVSHDFDMKGAKPKKTLTFNATDDSGGQREHTIYLWVVPFEDE